MPDDVIRSLLASVPLPMVVIGPDARLLAMNDRAEGLIETAVQLALTLATLIKEVVPGVDFEMMNVDMWDAEIMVGFSGPGEFPEQLRGYDDEGWE